MENFENHQHENERRRENPSAKQKTKRVVSFVMLAAAYVPLLAAAQRCSAEYNHRPDTIQRSIEDNPDFAQCLDEALTAEQSRQLTHSFDQPYEYPLDSDILSVVDECRDHTQSVLPPAPLF